MEGQDQQFTIDQFREMKQSGVDPYAALEQQEVEVDAAPNVDEEPQYDEPADDEQDHIDTPDEPDAEPETPIEPSAWKKRAERERKKGAEEAEARLKAEYEEQYNPYKKFFEQLGVDPQTAMQAIEQNKLKQEAEQLAYQNGWDETQTQWYINQQKQESELRDLRVSVQINDLADKSDYPGIKTMKTAISSFIKDNPRMTVEQAYWAVGGQSLAQQLKREAQQREANKRSQTKRTVVSDAPQTMDGPAPLTPEQVQFARMNKMSEADVRALVTNEFKTIDDYRAWKKKQGR